MGLAETPTYFQKRDKTTLKFHDPHGLIILKLSQAEQKKRTDVNSKFFKNLKFTNTAYYARRHYLADSKAVFTGYHKSSGWLRPDTTKTNQLQIHLRVKNQ